MARSIPKGDPSAMADAKGILIPTGDYWDVLIDSVEEAKSKKSGQDMYVFKLIINDDIENAKGRRITTRACLWYEARYTIIQINKSIGLPVEDENGDFYVGEPYEYQGQTTAIRVVHESSAEYGDQANVKSFLVQKKGAASGPTKAAGKVPFGSGGGGAQRPAQRPSGRPQGPVTDAMDKAASANA